MTGNSLSFGDVRKACKRYADEFLRDPKEHDTRGPHTVYVSRAKGASVMAEEQEGNTDAETALAAWPGKATSIWRKPMSRRYCAGLQRIATVTGITAGEPRLQARDWAYQWRETISS